MTLFEAPEHVDEDLHNKCDDFHDDCYLDDDDMLGSPFQKHDPQSSAEGCC